MLCGEAASNTTPPHAREELSHLEAQMQKSCDERFVLFVGDTGAGKSKKINQLLGDSHVLPSAGEGVLPTSLA